MLARAPPPPPTAPKGFNVCEDVGDGYKFLYPFGWQEVAVTGADVVFKDIVEPLESVSITITSTDKADITEFGPIQEVGGSRAARSGLRGLLCGGQIGQDAPRSTLRLADGGAHAALRARRLPRRWPRRC